MYILTIVGVWKMLAVPALLAPRLGLLKEWAYAGVFFEMTGAAVSHMARGGGPEVIVTLADRGSGGDFLGLRPASRRCGVAADQAKAQEA